MTGQVAGTGRAGVLRRLILNLLVLGIALGAAALLAEVAVRIVAPQQLVQIRPDIWQPADSVGWVNRANVRTTINTGERTVRLYTDSLGLRVGAAGRRDAPTRVLIIGDSFMEALQVEYEQSFAALLESGLTRRRGQPVAVWNAGVDGWDPPQYLVRARQLLDRASFDLVVVSLYLGNDIVLHRPAYIPPRATDEHTLRIPHALSASELKSAVLYPLSDALRARSQLFILLRTRLHAVLMRMGLTGEYFPEELQRSQAASTRWDVTADLCRDIAEAARQHGIAALFVVIPTPFAVDTAAFRFAQRGFGLQADSVDIDQPDRLMGERLEARGLHVIRVQTPFRELGNAGTALYGSVDRHLTPRGNVELERLVEPAADSLLVQTPRAPAATTRIRHSGH